MTAVLEPLVDEITAFDVETPVDVDPATIGENPTVISARALRITPLNGDRVREALTNLDASMRGLATAMERLTRRPRTLPDDVVGSQFLGDIDDAHIKVAVEQGVAVLDRILGRETWLSRVDERTLDLASPLNCVLAQAFRTTYGDAVRFARCHQKVPMSHSGTWGWEHGFEAASLYGYSALQREWLRTLAELRKEVSA